MTAAPAVTTTDVAAKISARSDVNVVAAAAICLIKRPHPPSTRSWPSGQRAFRTLPSLGNRQRSSDEHLAGPGLQRLVRSGI